MDLETCGQRQRLLGFDIFEPASNGELSVVRAESAQRTVYHPTPRPAALTAHLRYSTGFADERGKGVLALEGEQRGISQVQVNDCELDDIEKLGSELKALGTRLQGLENEKRERERHVQALQHRESERKLIESRL